MQLGFPAPVQYTTSEPRTTPRAYVADGISRREIKIACDRVRRSTSLPARLNPNRRIGGKHPEDFTGDLWDSYDAVVRLDMVDNHYAAGTW